MARIELVNPAEYMPAVVQLMRDNWAETGFDFEFNPSIEAYQRLYDAGLMFALAAFDGDEVIGYCAMTVMGHLHNPDVTFASNDALYVRPDHRGITSVRLIQAAEAEAKQRGASRFLWHTRAGTPMAAMLERRGYKPVDITVMKEL